MTEPCTVPANSRKALKGLRQQQVTWEDRELCCHAPGASPRSCRHEAGLGRVCAGFLSVRQAPLSPISKASFCLSIYSLHHQKLSSSPKTDISKSYCSLLFWWNQ